MVIEVTRMGGQKQQSGETFAACRINRLCQHSKTVRSLTLTSKCISTLLASTRPLQLVAHSPRPASGVVASDCQFVIGCSVVSCHYAALEAHSHQKTAWARFGQIRRISSSSYRRNVCLNTTRTIKTFITWIQLKLVGSTRHCLRCLCMHARKN